ncbi:hypothetical protein E4U24_003434 [Claviceps purpurea]|nr:hypothetical protein E4U24_003434 [Claviceps purpurea]
MELNLVQAYLLCRSFVKSIVPIHYLSPVTVASLLTPLSILRLRLIEFEFLFDGNTATRHMFLQKGHRLGSKKSVFFATDYRLKD